MDTTDIDTAARGGHQPRKKISDESVVVGHGVVDETPLPFNYDDCLSKVRVIRINQSHLFLIIS